jgi:hypothetical protein
MDSKILIKQFDALGASAIVLPFGELYTALQNGVVEGQENPLDIIQKMKFFEVQKNLLVTDHGPSSPRSSSRGSRTRTSARCSRSPAGARWRRRTSRRRS